MRYWIVRAGTKDSRAVNYAIETSVVGIGWYELGNLVNIESKADIREKYYHCEEYQGRNPATVTKHTNDIWTFLKDFEREDIVFFPELKSSIVHLGVIRGDSKFKGDGKLEYLTHIRKVKWQNKFYRRIAPDYLQDKLRIRRTVIPLSSPPRELLEFIITLLTR